MISEMGSEICRLLILLTLLLSSYHKLCDWRGFAASLVEDFRVPKQFGIVSAIVIIAIEALTALMILSGEPWQIVGLYLAAALFLLLSLVLARVLYHKQRVFCQCFGRSRYPISSLDLLRNGIYFFVAVFAAIVDAAIALTWLEQAMLFLIALPIFLLTIHLNELQWLLQEQTHE